MLGQSVRHGRQPAVPTCFLLLLLFSPNLKEKVLPSGSRTQNQILSWIQSDCLTAIPIQAAGFSKDKQLRLRRLGLSCPLCIGLTCRGCMRVGSVAVDFTAGRHSIACHTCVRTCMLPRARPCRALWSLLVAVVRIEFICCPITAKLGQSSGDILSLSGCSRR